MYDLLSAIIAYLQAAPTGFQGFIGSYTSGVATERGPFLDVAPEHPGGIGPDLPYMVYNKLAGGMDQGFGGTGSSYSEKPIIRFHLYDDDPDRLAQNTDLFVNTLDVVSPVTVGCGAVLRKQDPALFAEPMGSDGKRVYRAMVSYEFWVSKTKGS